MTLDEMLQYVGAEFLDDRTELIEGDNDELWSDAFLVRQFNEAQRILCRRAWVLREYDATEASRIILVTGKELYKLHTSVLFVFDATPSTQTYPVGRADDIDLRAPASRSLDAYTIGERAAISDSVTAGVTLAIASDAATRTIRVSPAPAAAQSGVHVALKIARLPLVPLSLDSVASSPEVPEEYHMGICEYAAGKALTLPNVDGDQKVEGRRLLSAFDELVRQARQDMQRAGNNFSRWAYDSSTSTLGV